MDQAGLEQFIGQYGRDIYSFCCYLTRSRQEADDLYQDIFVKATEAQVFPEDVEGAKNLLLSVAVNLWKDKRRKFSRRRQIEEEKYIPQVMEEVSLNDRVNLPEEYMIRNEKSMYVRRCVEMLPEKMKLMVLLFYMENRKIEEISQMMGIPVGTVKSRLYRAKKILAKKLTEMSDKESYIGLDVEVMVNE